LRLVASREGTTEILYPYRDAAGALLYEIVRKPGKEFRARRPDGNGGYHPNLDGVKRVPFRLERLASIDSGYERPILWVEGEKDVLTAEALGFVATTTAGGANNFKPEVLESAKPYLAGRGVVILPDNDEAGRKYAEAVEAALSAITSNVRVLNLPGLPEKGDLTDWVEAGGTTKRLVELLVQSDAGDCTGSCGSQQEEGQEFQPGCRSGEESAQPQTPSTLNALPLLNASPRPVSAAQDAAAMAPRATLRFRTAAELFASAPDETEWIAAYTAPGAITDLTGAPKLSGKTSLAMGMAKAVISGTPFLGQPTRQGSVLYLSEERDITLRESLRRAGLAEAEGFHFLQPYQAHGVLWNEVVEWCMEQGKTLGACVLVVDTFLPWSGLGEEQENDAGASYAVMKPLLRAADSGLAVWVLRHDRKAGGANGKSARGSNAISGAADLLLQLARVGDNRPNVRKITYDGRFDAPPREQLITRTSQGYRLVGSNETQRDRLLEVAPSSEREAEAPEWFMEQTGIGRDTTRGLLRELGAEGLLVELGTGLKSGKYRYYAPQPVSSFPV
jgi:hypothetical protein